MARPRTVLVKKFEKHIEGNLGITVEDTRSPEHAAFVDKLLDLLHWDEALLSSRVELRRPELAKAKLNALIRDLKSFLHGRLDGKRWVHVCTFGCCEGGVEESRARLVELISLVFLHRIPNVPALNKWTQLYPSISWWAVAMQLHKFIQMIWAKAFPGCGDRDDPVLDLLAPAGEEILSGLNKVRAGKVMRWAWHPKTQAELAVVCISLRAVLSFMGFLFKQEAESAQHSITVLLKNPSECHRVVNFLIARLLNIDGDFWLVYRFGGLDEWKLQLALDVVLRLAASLSYRLIYCFEIPP